LWRFVAGGFSEDIMAKKASSFRVGSVQAYLRGQVWYLCYHENNKRRRPRVGPDREAAKQMAAQINGQLAVGAPAALSFEPIAIPELRDRWLQHHEQVLRSSVQTLNRYRTATDHLLRFLEQRPVRNASQLHATHAEEFVCHLRTIKVSPNGHANTAKRLLMDKGLRYILECCRAMFNYAAKRRHLSPYAENPFRTLEIDRIPIEYARPIELFNAEQEKAFLEACDDWQFPLFLTLMLTGMRPGELCHLLLPDDLDLETGWLKVRNKPRLGWRVKTRNERDIPLLTVLVDVLRRYVGDRRTGPVFRRRRSSEASASTGTRDVKQLERELAERIENEQTRRATTLTNKEKLRLAQRLWLDIGALQEDRIRLEYMRLARTIGLPGYTAPKMLRHMFATTLQEGRVDPLIRNELMGHVAPGDRAAGHGLAMTAVYTHTRPETKRAQLEAAFAPRIAVDIAARRAC
jgi:integrase